MLAFAGVLLFDVPPVGANALPAAGVFLLTLFALYGLGMTFASLFLLWGREAWHLVNLLQEPVFLLTGMNFPVSIFRGYPLLLGAALLIPLTLGMDALRQLLFPAGAGLFPVGPEAAGLALLGVVFMVLARISLAAMERRAKVAGRLGLRWQ